MDFLTLASWSPPPASPSPKVWFLQVGHSGGGADDAEVLDEVRPVSYAHEWLLVAAAVDRLAAFAFTAAFVVTLIAYTSAL